MLTLTLTDNLITRYREQCAAREALASVNWMQLPGMLHALGAELLPADADTLRRPHDWMNIQEIVSIRRILAAHGDRLARVSAPAGLAARKVCCEIVGATGAALALIDYVSLV